MTSDGTGFNADEAQVGPLHCDLDCSGVRDSDWAKHNPNTPDTPQNFICPSCGGGSGPCGRQVHCAAATERQSAWDLVTRDLTAGPFNMSSETAFITGNRVFLLAAGGISQWYSCTCPNTADGCGAASGYMQFLAADDDNGNVNTGTPHMTAIHAAFNRHNNACANPAPQNSGCAGGPTGAPTLSGNAATGKVSLSWTSVAGATGYWVYRSEGHAGCNFGKTKIADVTGLSFNDTGLSNGRQYHYNIVAHGSSTACFGAASNCLSLQPERTKE
jgi:hypothetical protein